MIKNKKINKIVPLIIILIVFIASYSVAFKDSSPEVNKATEKFAEEGLFGSFIYQYGDDLFRPDGYITREGLILLLSEYHIITQKLLHQNRKMLSRLNKLKKTESLNTGNIDKILQNFKTFQAINHDISKVSKTSSSNAEIGELKEKIRILDEKFGEIDKRSNLTLRSHEEPMMSIDNLPNEVNKLNKNVEDLWKLCSEIMKSVALSDISLTELKIIKTKLTDFKKDNELYKKNIDVILNKKYISKTEFNEVKNEIKHLNKKVKHLIKISSEKDIDKKKTSKE